jgi:acyl-CoA thioester hydrolase
MNIPAPFESSIMKVEPQWIDYNGHLNMAYYNVLFDRCTDEAFALFGLGEDYVKTRNASFYTMEAHVTYLRELMVDAPVRMTFQLLDYDSKRCHTFVQMYHADQGYLAATSEMMFLHVDMGAKKACPFPDDVLPIIKAMHEAHSKLPVPPQVGHVIGIPRKN